MDYSKLADEFLQYIHLLRRFKPQQQINESMYGEAYALYYIASRGEGIIPSEISGAIGISSARIAATLNGLENKGYITRRIDTSDRRRILVSLTDRGRAQEKAYRGKLIEIIEQMLGVLGENDAKEYVRITRKMAESAVCDDAAPQP